jgi:hypothetical protein
MASLLSVNVGMPADVSWQGKTVRTGIWKQPAPGRRMARRLNIDGDGQGDLNGHGLRACGLSLAKASCLVDLAGRQASGLINLRHMDDTPDVRDRGTAWVPHRTYAAALLWRSLNVPSLAPQA